MTMYIDATRLTIGLESEATRSRLLINRDHIVTIEEVPRGIHITTVNGSKYLIEATYEDAIDAVNKQERKTKEARDRVAKEVSQLNLDLAAWSKRQEDDEESQDLAKSNQVFIYTESLKSGLSVELEGTASQEVFDLIMGKRPEQELREITMVAKIVDDQPAHEAARPPRRTRRRIRRYRRWPR